MNTSFQVYRGAKVGDCLRQSLFELMESEKLSEEVADKVLSQFDKSMYLALDTKVQAKAQLKGRLRTYRYIDNVWQFVLENVSLKLHPTGRGGNSGNEVKMDSSKLICVDSKLVQKEKEEREGREREREREAELLRQQALQVNAEEGVEGNSGQTQQPSKTPTPQESANPSETQDAKPDARP